jgi:hypothetical protein
MTWNKHTTKHCTCLLFLNINIKNADCEDILPDVMSFLCWSTLLKLTSKILLPQGDAAACRTGRCRVSIGPVPVGLAVQQTHVALRILCLPCYLCSPDVCGRHDQPADYRNVCPLCFICGLVYEELTVCQLVSKFACFYRMWQFITVFTRARHCAGWTNPHSHTRYR